MFFGLFKTTKYHKDLSEEEFRNALKSDRNAILLDVRTPSEFSGGKIKGAKNINVMSFNFSDSIKNLPMDKNYYIYCRSGARSSRACKIMGKAGFKNLYNLKGGILSWKGNIQ